MWIRNGFYADSDAGSASASFRIRIQGVKSCLKVTNKFHKKLTWKYIIYFLFLQYRYLTCWKKFQNKKSIVLFFFFKFLALSGPLWANFHRYINLVVFRNVTRLRSTCSTRLTRPWTPCTGRPWRTWSTSSRREPSSSPPHSGTRLTRIYHSLM